METNLLPISQIVKSARQSGVTFGHGDPKIHLAYLTKLRLLPQTLRRKIGGRIEGCYPEYVIPLIKRIEEFKEAGLTYSQIKFQLQNFNQIQDVSRDLPDSKAGIQVRLLSSFQSPASLPVSNFLSPVSGSSNTIAFLIVGLLLGYLLALTNVSRPNSQSPVTNDKSPMTSSAISPLDDQSQTMLRIITGNQTDAKNPIYVIAVPKQNFYHLGTTNINDLIR